MSRTHPPTRKAWNPASCNASQIELASSRARVSECINKLCASVRKENSRYSQRSTRQVISSDCRVEPTKLSTCCIKNCKDPCASQSDDITCLVLRCE